MVQTRSQSARQRHKKNTHELSSLPEDVIHVILNCLQLRDAVRTSILSHFWRYQWTNIRQLVVDDINFPRGENQSQIEYESKLVRIVDRLLVLHQGSIHKFHLSIKLKSSTNMDRWILFVLRNDIREVILHNRYMFQRYNVPSCLFSCEHITYLELKMCSLIPSASFSGFINLKTLNLRYVTVSNNGLENLISKSPHLKKLDLFDIDGCSSHLKLCAPNLVDFTVVGTFKDICFEKTPILAKAYIDLLESNEYNSLPNGATCKLISILSCLPSIRELGLSENTYQILSATSDVPFRLPTPCQLLRLVVSINFEDTQDMFAALCIFRSSSFLNVVKISSISYMNRSEISIRDFWEAQENFNFLLSQLQSLTVTNYKGTTSELKFIEFVLANAPVLVVVTLFLEDNEIVDANEILKKLPGFRRFSSTVLVHWKSNREE